MTDGVERLRSRLEAVGRCPRPAVTSLAEAIAGRYDRAFDKIGMSSSQFTLLSAIGWAGESTLTGLTRFVARDQTTLSRGVQKLRERGWVETVQQADDRRVHRVRLTPAGITQLSDAMDAWERVRDELEQALGTEVLEHLIDLSWTGARALAAADATD